MTAHDDIPDLILGSGGSHPGALGLYVRGQSVSTPCFMPLPASVYAVDLDPARGLVACGTSAGLIHLISFDDPANPSSSPKIRRRLHGRPTLSVAFTGDGRLISSDDTGQVLCWDTDPNPGPQVWLTGGPPICALSAPSDLHVFGLRVDGQIFIWDLHTGGPITQLNGLPPIAPFALVRLTPWQTQGRLKLCYPAEDGRLVIIENDPPVIHVRQAHQGRWYSAFTIEDRLVTLGYDDATARFWQWAGDGPTCSDIRPGFETIISAEYVPAADPPIGVAVLASGMASQFGVTTGGLAALESIPGENYRIVAAPTEWMRQRNESRRRREQAEKLQRSIAVAIDEDEAMDYDRSLAELRALGNVAESWVLQAHRSMRTKDQLTELSAWHRLAHEHAEVYRALLPESAERYSFLLTRFGQIEQALIATDGFTEVQLETAPRCADQGLRIAVAALRSARMVVHALSDDRPCLEEVLQACQILDAPPVGSWELRRSAEAILSQVRLEPDQLLEALQTDGMGHLGHRVHATVEPVVWKRGDAFEELDTLLIRLPGTAAGATLRVALRLAPQSGGTVLTRSLLLDLKPTDPTGANGHDHARLIRLASQLQATPAGHVLLAPIHTWLSTTLRRLRGQHLAVGLPSPGGVA